MLRSIDCVHHHNLWLVLLAVAVCTFAFGTSLRLMFNARRAASGSRARLLAISGACGGCGAWATHFIAMLAFDPGMNTAYDLFGTLASLGIALFGGAVGVVATVLAPRAWRYLAWGAAFGGGAGAMHYTGMAALRVPGHLSWNPGFVVASFLVGGLFAMASLRVAVRMRTSLGFIGATLLMVVATCSLHFLGMAGMSVAPDPTVVVAVGAIPHAVLAIAVGALTLLIGLICLWTIWIEAHGQKLSLRLIHAMVDAMPQAIAYFDENDRFVLSNGAYSQEFAQIGLALKKGMPSSALLRASVRANMADASDEDRAAWIAARVQSRLEPSSSFDEPTADGRFMRIEARRTAIGGSVTVISDISSLKQQAAELALALKAAEAADKAKSVFLANMSHELRTPMNGVIAVADLLAAEPLSPRQAELVSLIRSSGTTLDRVLCDILDITQAETGALEIRTAPFDLEPAVESVISLLRPAAEAKGLQLTVDFALHELGPVLGDEVRLKQILSNLISNGVKFTETGSVDVHVAWNAETATFRIADTGIGFDAAQSDRLFQAFEKEDGSLTRRFGGSGLGLPISRDLAMRMGGSLTCESEPGKGSAFELALSLPVVAHPLAEDDRSAWPRSEPADEDLSAAHILVVDDNPTNQRVLTLILDGAGIRTSLADNGQKAVDAFRAEHFDAVLMDIQMPVMDGLSATRAIRTLEQAEGRPPTPILMVSANAMPEHVAASHAAGADGHVAKPVTASRLFDALAHLGEPGGAEAEPTERAA